MGNRSLIFRRKEIKKYWKCRGNKLHLSDGRIETFGKRPLGRQRSRWEYRSALSKDHRVDYLLTAWIRVILEKPTGSQLVKKFPAFYGTQSFISAFTSARHLSLS